MSWFDNIKNPKINKGAKTKAPESAAVRVPEGFWVKCSACGEILQAKVLKENLGVCPECEFHFRVGARERIDQLFGSKFKEQDMGLTSLDPLEFTDTKAYKQRLVAAEAATENTEALITGVGELPSTGDPIRVAAAVFEFRFLGGSMGTVVGEKLSRVLETALEMKIPAVVVCSSGGARMQEGILSLMQMAKTTAMVQQLGKERLPFVPVLADPTTGGVAASFAMLGDLTLAEPGALIGFAGPRVIEQTIRQALPAGFQRSEFLLKHGFVDMIVNRKEMAGTLSRALSFITRRAKLGPKKTKTK